jgi:hypothetical protein
MHLKTLFFLTILLTASTLKAQSADSLKIKAVLYEFFEVFSQFDYKYVESTTTKDFELYDVGLVWNNDSINTYITSNQKPFKRENKFDFIKFNIKRNIAWVSYWNRGIFHNQNGSPFSIRWLESAILEKRKGIWKLVQLHSTRVGNN